MADDESTYRYNMIATAELLAGRNPWAPADRDIYHDSCCTDCLMLIANDDTSGNDRCQTEEGEAAYRAEVARRTAGYLWCPSSWPDVDWTDDDRYFGRDCEPAFSWSGCTFCGSSIGGDRHPVSGIAL